MARFGAKRQLLRDEAKRPGHGAGPQIRRCATGVCVHAPTLYHRWSDTRGGRAVVSEPLETGECWEAVPPGSFCVFDGDEVRIEGFVPHKVEGTLAAE